MSIPSDIAQIVPYRAALVARQDFGVVGAGAASMWARYAGNGAYTVTITAWSDGKRVKRGAAGAGG